MFGSTILDVAFGLIFAFLTLSLATSSIVEVGASFTQWRSKMLLSGMKSLVNNDDLVRQLYNHALVNPRNPGSTSALGLTNKPTNNPAYIDSKQFAGALMDIIGLSQKIGALAVAGPTSPPTAQSLSALKATATAGLATNPQLETLIHGIIDRALGDPDKIGNELAAWFDNGMDRLSGLYKRWTQLISFVIALALAIALNVDSIGIARELWAQPVLADKIKTDPKLPDYAAAETELESIIPIGWSGGYPFHKSEGGEPVWVSGTMKDLGIPLVGWLITALSTLFGAPFWFDALQSIARLKGTGPSPNEKKTGSAASA